MDNGVDEHQSEEPPAATSGEAVEANDRAKGNEGGKVVEEAAPRCVEEVGDVFVKPRGQEIADPKESDAEVDGQIGEARGLESQDGILFGNSESLDVGNNATVAEVQELGVSDGVDVKVLEGGEDGNEIEALNGSQTVANADSAVAEAVEDGNMNETMSSEWNGLEVDVNGDGAAVQSREDGNKKEDVTLESDGAEADGVANNGEVCGVDLNEVKPDELVGDDHQEPENGTVHELELPTEELEFNGSHACGPLQLENGQPVVLEMDKIDSVEEMEQQEVLELVGLDESNNKESENGEIMVLSETSHSLSIESEQNKDAPHAEVCVDEDTVDDVSKEHLEEDAMAVAIMEYVKEAVLAGRSKEKLEQNKEKVTLLDSKPEAPTQSGTESVVVEELYDSSSSDDDNKVTSSLPAPSATSTTDSSNGPTLPSRPAGLGSSASLLEPHTRSVQQAHVNSPATSQRETQQAIESIGDDAEENDEIREKLQMIRVKFLRLAHRLGQTPHNVVVSQVLYRLGLAEQLRRNTTRPGGFSFDRAREMAEHLEAAGNEPLDFSCTIMVIGKTGVGKSATINSIFDDVTLQTNAFELSTRKVQEIVGMVQGIKVKVIDTPGLSCSSSDQCHNQKVLHSVKRLISKNPPDIVLYFDRLDMQNRDYGDVLLLRTITDVFGASIWFNAIVVLTHAASAPPDGPNGIPLSYEMFVTQRSHVVQQAIRQAAGDVRLMNPVSLVENHSACRTNRAGQRVLPNGQVWKPQLLLLCFASKILAEANMLLKLQDSPPGKPFRTRIPPLPFLLSSLLQSRPPLKLPEEHFGDDDALEDDLVEESDSDDGSDYDDLPPFKRLTKSQLANLNRAQKKAYFEELDYREKLLYKKQLKEERMRWKLMKKIAAEASDQPDAFSNRNVEDDSNAPTSIAVPMPDMVLPSSFDSDYPSHRYRFLDTSSEWLVRPVLETQGWDHDVGYEGLNVERLFAVKDKVPLSVSGQLTKDKKECTLQMEVVSSVKHGEGKTTSLGLDLQSVGKDMAYTIRGESRFKNFRRNNTAAGLSVTLLGDSVSAGLKIEDKLIVNKQLRVLASGGAMTGRGDVAYGGRLEATLRDKDYPIGRMLSTLALSVVDWHGDLAVSCNVQSQIPMGRGTNLIGHANLSNKGTGQLGIRLNSSEHLQIALIALVPIFGNIKKMLPSSSQST